MAQMDFEIDDGIEILDMDEQSDDEVHLSPGTVSPDEFLLSMRFALFIRQIIFFCRNSEI